MAQDTICKQKSYIYWCEENNYMVNPSKPRSTAEILYQYLTGNIEYKEEHTGLADVLIEKDLLATYDMLANIGPLEADSRPKHYEVEIDATLSKKQFLLSLAHEMIHLKQFAKNQMRDLESKKMTRWNGDYYMEDNIDYWSRPWEIEAHEGQTKLYEDYIKNNKQ
jgi:hypothetical protein